MARLEPYLIESESLRLIDAIGATLYEWLDASDFTGAGPFLYTRPDGLGVSITKDEHTVVLDGGYFTGCGGERKWTAGLVPSIAYIAYSRFVMNNPINATAFGVVHKLGEFSTPVDDNVLVRNSNEARKVGEAYLATTIEHLTALQLIGCATYIEAPRRIIRVGQHKL